MKDIVHKKCYIHFICPCIAIRIVSDKQYAHLFDDAQSNLKYFVEYYGVLRRTIRTQYTFITICSIFVQTLSLKELIHFQFLNLKITCIS